MSDLNLSELSDNTALASTFALSTDNPATFKLPEEFLKVNMDGFKASSLDFAATAYVNPRTRDLVVVYRDSDATTDLPVAVEAATGDKWDRQFTDAASFVKQAQELAAAVIQTHAGESKIIRSELSTLVTGHGLGGLLAQVMYGENSCDRF